MDSASARGGLPNCRVFLVLRDEQGAAGIRLWAVQDATWNMVALVNNPGAVVERYSYTPFGEATVLNADGTVKPAGSGYNWVYLFQGGRFDPVTGTTFFQNRDYDPRGMRWTTPDPLGYAAGDMNLYRPMGNNPTSYVDPTGQFGIIGFFVGGAVSSLIQIGSNLYDGRDWNEHVGVAFATGAIGGATGGLSYLGLRGVARLYYKLCGRCMCT